MKRIFITLFILLSFITQTLMPEGKSVIFSRLTPADIFGALSLIFGITYLFKGFIFSLKLSNIYQGSIVLLLCFFLPSFFSLNIRATIVECLIILFLVLLSINIFYTFKDNLLDKLLPLIMYLGLIASFIGIYDYAALLVGLPRIFPTRAGGEILSGFRNAGQAGAFFSVIVTILYPLKVTKLNFHLSKKNKKLLNFSLIVSVVFLMLTGKIAAYIGIFFGFVLYSILNRNTKTIMTLVTFIVAIGIVFVSLETIAPNVHNRLSIKFETRINNRLAGSVDEDKDFIAKNILMAFQAFEDRPLIGTGLAGFVGNYGEHEVHSTYFKMIGETGFIGTMGYIFFIIIFLRLVMVKRYNVNNPYADYLKGIFPFVIGCMISWGYTYHLRKREFWILVAVLVIVHYNARYFEINKAKKNELRENI